MEKDLRAERMEWVGAIATLHGDVSMGLSGRGKLAKGGERRGRRDQHFQTLSHNWAWIGQ
jgi:hypothetical protein